MHGILLHSCFGLHHQPSIEHCRCYSPPAPSTDGALAAFDICYRLPLNRPRPWRLRGVTSEQTTPRFREFEFESISPESSPHRSSNSVRVESKNYRESLYISPHRSTTWQLPQDVRSSRASESAPQILYPQLGEVYLLNCG